MPRKSSSSSSSSKGRRKVHKVMKEYKEGKLRSGSGGKPRSRKQAVAIALNEARESGAYVPKKGSSKKRGSSRKSASKKRGGSRKKK